MLRSPKVSAIFGRRDEPNRPQAASPVTTAAGGPATISSRYVPWLHSQPVAKNHRMAFSPDLQEARAMNRLQAIAILGDARGALCPIDEKMPDSHR